MTRTDLHQLVDDLPDDVVDATASFLRQVLLGKVDPEQFWFWTSEWQAEEREVDEGLERGDPGTTYDSDTAFLSSLAARTKPPQA